MAFAMRRPVTVPPVKSTRSTIGCCTKLSPAAGPVPGTTCTTPSGTPASLRSSAKMRHVNGASRGGFKTTVFPAASATEIFFVAISSGWFHGVMRPQTPKGTRQTRFTWSAPSASGGNFPSKPWEAAEAPWYSNHSGTRPSWALYSRKQRPVCCVSNVANSPKRWRNNSATLNSTRHRVRGGNSLQRPSWKAACAPRTAVSTSAAPAEATVATVAPVAGLSTFATAPSAASVRLPSSHSPKCGGGAAEEDAARAKWRGTHRTTGRTPPIVTPAMARTRPGLPGQLVGEPEA
mmetsp:Transcript_137507/g.439380  ORF Transcript_137507/g.439380 Transcript_137507/m.439380 type:complete len:291 (+) Transcript_137507:848-1720(+)